MLAKIAALRIPLPAPQPALLGRRRRCSSCSSSASIDRRPDPDRRGGGNVHKNAPVRASRRPADHLGLLHVRDDGVRRQRRSCATTRPASARSSARRGSASSTICSAASSAPSRSRRSAFLAVPLGDLARLADAVGRPARRSGRTGSPTTLYAYFVLGAAEHPHHRRDLLRPGDRDPLDDGDLPRRRSPSSSLYFVAQRASARPARARRHCAPWSSRSAWRAFGEATALLDDRRAQHAAPRVRGRAALQPAALDRRRRRSSSPSPIAPTASPTRASRSASARSRRWSSRPSAERAAPPAPAAPLPVAAHGRAALRASSGRAPGFEMRQVFKSPAFIVLMALGLFNAFGGLWFGGELFGTPTLPVTPVADPDARGHLHDHPADHRHLLCRRAGLARARPQDARDRRRDAAAQLGLCRAQDAGAGAGAARDPAGQRARRGRSSSCSRATPTSSSASICSGTCCRAAST